MGPLNCGMRQAIWIFGLACLVAACTTEVAGERPDAGAGSNALWYEVIHPEPQSHGGILLTPEIHTCREACWADIPYNRCLEQKQACLATAQTGVDRRHCTHMTHTCRRTRRSCLRSCWTDPKTPDIKKLQLLPDQGPTTVEDSAGDEPAAD
jgi:hypothetical protein